jgi:uncharacterized RDD family membrane protein YckC
VSVPHPEPRPSAGPMLSRRAVLTGSPALATYGQRVGAFLIDVGIPTGLLVTVLIAALLTRDLRMITVVYVLSALVSIVFLLWNSGYRQGTSGQSIGKMALGVQLVAQDTGLPVGFRRAVGRQVAHLLDGLPLGLGYLWPLWDEERQTFADKVCSTLVVQADF